MAASLVTLCAADAAFVAAVRAGLAARADAAKAPAMQTYMKSNMPFYGVSSPERSTLLAELFRDTSFSTLDAWRATALKLWREASRREERYAAIALLRCRQYSAYAHRLEMLSVYEELVRTGAWWVRTPVVGRVVFYLRTPTSYRIWLMERPRTSLATCCAPIRRL